MEADGIVILALAHTIKWPCAVRYFHKMLIQSGCRPLTCTVFVDAFHETVKFFDGKALKKMHVGLSVARRSHAMSGIIRAALMLGVIVKASRQSTLIVDSTRVRLGPALTEFVLKPGSDCTAMVGLVEKYLVSAKCA